MILETDASDHALADIFFIWSNGKVCLIAFHLRAFSAVEINYDVHNKELLAIVKLFKKWQHYLKGVCKGDWGTRLQENPQVYYSLWLWYNSPLGESSEIRMRLLEGYSTLYTGSASRVSEIRAKLVYLSITSKQARVAPECCHAV